MFIRARDLPHQPIPDFNFDGEYLELLGRSAARGFAPALAKLGDYAMRRGAWVEAYFWMWQAKRGGMGELGAVLREIRRNWTRDDFPTEEANVHMLFSEEAGSIGRALLSIDSGHDVFAAKEYLRAVHPEFLSETTDEKGETC